MGSAEAPDKLLKSAQEAKEARQYSLAETACRQVLALEDSVACPETNARVLSLLGELRALQGFDREAVTWLEKAAVAAVDSALSPEEKSTILLEMAHAQREIGDFPAARRSADNARVILEEADLKGGFSWGRLLLIHGSICFKEGSLSEAARDIAESLAIFEGTDQHQELARIHEYLGYISRKQGDWNRAVEYFEKSWAVRKVLNDDRGMMISSAQLASIHKDRGNLHLAVHYYDQALTIARSLKDKRSLAALSNNLGGLYLRRGEWDKAESCWLESLRLADEIGNPGGKKVIHSNLFEIALERRDLEQARVHATACQVSTHNVQEKIRERKIWGRLLSQQGDQTAAIESYKTGLAIAETAGMKELIPDLYLYLAEAFLLAGDDHQSRRSALESLRLYRQMRNREGIAQSLQHLASAHLARGRTIGARKAIREAIAILGDMGARYELAQAYLAAAPILIASGELKDAESYLSEAVSIFRQMGLDYRLGVTHLYLARVERQGGNHESGLSHLRIAQESLAQCDNAKIAHEVQLAARDLEEAIVRGCARDGGGEFSNVLKVSQILGGKEPEDKRLLKALELLTRWVQADAGMILVVDPRSGKKEAEVSLDLSRPVLDQVRRFLQKQIQGARGPLLFLAGSEDMILLDSAGKTPGSALVVPLRAGEHLLGGLYLERGSEREYLGPRQVTLALASADVVSLALHGFYFERRLREHLSAQVLYQEIITQNQQMQEIIRIIEKVKDSSATVLILGESGTGKELVARALHKAGKRGNGPFVAVNCSAIPETLLESELFGCVRGAYTGADRDRRGLFEQANGGTIFLDEIAETTPAFQSKLLRVLEEKAIRPVGGNQERPVNVRVVCATNKDLRQETTEGRFRQDLFYRLSVVPLSLPPLRERREDIPLLARHFLEKYAAQEEVEVPDLSSRLMREFLEYDWPGNVRELENVIRRLVSMGDEESIELPRGEEYRLGAGRVSDGEADRQSLFAARRRIETEVVLDALHRADGNKTEAARLLGISRTALYKKLKVLDIEAS